MRAPRKGDLEAGKKALEFRQGAAVLGLSLGGVRSSNTFAAPDQIFGLARQQILHRA